jgi:hypothetical protein
MVKLWRCCWLLLLLLVMYLASAQANVYNATWVETWNGGTNYVTRGIEHTFSPIPAGTNIYLKVEVINTDFHNPKTQYIDRVGVGTYYETIITEYCFPQQFLRYEPNVYFVCVENVDVTDSLVEVNGVNTLSVNVKSTYDVSYGTYNGYLLYVRLTLAGIKTPTSQPTSQPSTQPSRQPSSQPTRQPTAQPTAQPSRQPTSQPSRQPFGTPTGQPSEQPTCQPSSQPSAQPTSNPSTSQPTGTPSYHDETKGEIRWIGPIATDESTQRIDGIVTGSWHNRWNWDRHIVPDVNHTVIVALSPGKVIVVSESVVVKNLNVSGAGGTLFLSSPSVVIEVTDTLQFDGGVIEGFRNGSNGDKVQYTAIEIVNMQQASVKVGNTAIFDTVNKKFLRFIHFVVQHSLDWLDGEIVMASSVIDMIGDNATFSAKNQSSQALNIAHDVAYYNFQLFPLAQLNQQGNINHTLPVTEAVNDLVLTGGIRITNNHSRVGARSLAPLVVESEVTNIGASMYYQDINFDGKQQLSLYITENNRSRSFMYATGDADACARVCLFDLAGSFCKSFEHFPTSQTCRFSVYDYEDIGGLTSALTSNPVNVSAVQSFNTFPYSTQLSESFTHPRNHIGPLLSNNATVVNYYRLQRNQVETRNTHRPVDSCVLLRGLKSNLVVQSNTIMNADVNVFLNSSQAAIRTHDSAALKFETDVVFAPLLALNASSELEAAPALSHNDTAQIVMDCRSKIEYSGSTVLHASIESACLRSATSWGSAGPSTLSQAPKIFFNSGQHFMSSLTTFVGILSLNVSNTSTVLFADNSSSFSHAVFHEVNISSGGTLDLQGSVQTISAIDLNILNGGTVVGSTVKLEIFRKTNIEQQGVLTADGRGFGIDHGPGAGRQDPATKYLATGNHSVAVFSGDRHTQYQRYGFGSSGGAHGGPGGPSYVDSSTSNHLGYGSISNPLHWGSGGGAGYSTENSFTLALQQRRYGYGGGSIVLTTPSLTLNGVISADGKSGSAGADDTSAFAWTYNAGGGGGAGGSILLTISNQSDSGSGGFSGAGILSSRGGAGGYGGGLISGGGGAGGRIAIYIASTQTDSFRFKGNVSVAGGLRTQSYELMAQQSGPGTLYFSIHNASGWVNTSVVVSSGTVHNLYSCVKLHDCIFSESVNTEIIDEYRRDFSSNSDLLMDSNSFGIRPAVLDVSTLSNSSAGVNIIVGPYTVLTVTASKHSERTVAVNHIYGYGKTSFVKVVDDVRLLLLHSSVSIGSSNFNITNELFVLENIVVELANATIDTDCAGRCGSLLIGSDGQLVVSHGSSTFGGFSAVRSMVIGNTGSLIFANSSQGMTVDGGLYLLDGATVLFHDNSYLHDTTVFISGSVLIQSLESTSLLSWSGEKETPLKALTRVTTALPTATFYNSTSIDIRGASTLSLSAIHLITEGLVEMRQHVLVKGQLSSLTTASSLISQSKNSTWNLETGCRLQLLPTVNFILAGNTVVSSNATLEASSGVLSSSSHQLQLTDSNSTIIITGAESAFVCTYESVNCIFGRGTIQVSNSAVFVPPRSIGNEYNEGFRPSVVVRTHGTLFYGSASQLPSRVQSALSSFSASVFDAIDGSVFAQTFVGADVSVVDAGAVVIATSVNVSFSSFRLRTPANSFNATSEFRGGYFHVSKGGMATFFGDDLTISAGLINGQGTVVVGSNATLRMTPLHQFGGVLQEGAVLNKYYDSGYEHSNNDALLGLLRIHEIVIVNNGTIVTYPSIVGAGWNRNSSAVVEFARSASLLNYGSMKFKSSSINNRNVIWTEGNVLTNYKEWVYSDVEMSVVPDKGSIMNVSTVVQCAELCSSSGSAFPEQFGVMPRATDRGVLCKSILFNAIDKICQLFSYKVAANVVAVNTHNDNFYSQHGNANYWFQFNSTRYASYGSKVDNTVDDQSIKDLKWRLFTLNETWASSPPVVVNTGVITTLVSTNVPLTASENISAISPVIAVSLVQNGLLEVPAGDVFTVSNSLISDGFESEFVVDGTLVLSPVHSSAFQVIQNNSTVTGSGTLRFAGHAQDSFVHNISTICGTAMWHYYNNASRYYYDYYHNCSNATTQQSTQYYLPQFIDVDIAAPNLTVVLSGRSNVIILPVTNRPYATRKFEVKQLRLHNHSTVTTTALQTVVTAGTSIELYDGSKLQADLAHSLETLVEFMLCETCVDLTVSADNLVASRQSEIYARRAVINVTKAQIEDHSQVSCSANARNLAVITGFNQEYYYYFLGNLTQNNFTNYYQYNSTSNGTMYYYYQVVYNNLYANNIYQVNNDLQQSHLFGAGLSYGGRGGAGGYKSQYGVSDKAFSAHNKVNNNWDRAGPENRNVLFPTVNATTESGSFSNPTGNIYFNASLFSGSSFANVQHEYQRLYYQLFSFYRNGGAMKLNVAGAISISSSSSLACNGFTSPDEVVGGGAGGAIEVHSLGSIVLNLNLTVSTMNSSDIATLSGFTTAVLVNQFLTNGSDLSYNKTIRGYGLSCVDGCSSSAVVAAGGSGASGKGTVGLGGGGGGGRIALYSSHLVSNLNVTLIQYNATSPVNNTWRLFESLDTLTLLRTHIIVAFGGVGHINGSAGTVFLYNISAASTSSGAILSINNGGVISTEWTSIYTQPAFNNSQFNRDIVYYESAGKSMIRLRYLCLFGYSKVKIDSSDVYNVGKFIGDNTGRLFLSGGSVLTSLEVLVSSFASPTETLVVEGLLSLTLGTCALQGFSDLFVRPYSTLILSEKASIDTGTPLIPGLYKFTSVTVEGPSAAILVRYTRMFFEDSVALRKSRIQILASDAVNITIGGIISADGAGYPGSVSYLAQEVSRVVNRFGMRRGPGEGQSSFLGGAGGGFGGTGGSGFGSIGGNQYGNYTEPLEPGSGGGSARVLAQAAEFYFDSKYSDILKFVSGLDLTHFTSLVRPGDDNIDDPAGYRNWSLGGSGGGIVFIDSPVLYLNGRISADGASGNYPGCGGGSGGSVYLRVGHMVGNGSVTADGGDGIFHITSTGHVDDLMGGPGSGGRVAIDCWSCTEDVALGKLQSGWQTHYHQYNAVHNATLANAFVGTVSAVGGLYKVGTISNSQTVQVATGNIVLMDNIAHRAWDTQFQSLSAWLSSSSVSTAVSAAAGTVFWKTSNQTKDNYNTFSVGRRLHNDENVGIVEEVHDRMQFAMKMLPITAAAVSMAVSMVSSPVSMYYPTTAPTASPTASPTAPTALPTTAAPTVRPTALPTAYPLIHPAGYTLIIDNRNSGANSKGDKRIITTANSRYVLPAASSTIQNCPAVYTCPVGFILIPGAGTGDCYYYDNSLSVTEKIAANSVCPSYHGTSRLASFHSWTEVEAVVALYNSSSGNSVTEFWMTGPSSIFGYNASNVCVKYQNGAVVSTSTCSEELPYMCKVQLGLSPCVEVDVTGVMLPSKNDSRVNFNVVDTIGNTLMLNNLIVAQNAHAVLGYGTVLNITNFNNKDYGSAQTNNNSNLIQDDGTSLFTISKNAQLQLPPKLSLSNVSLGVFGSVIGADDLSVSWSVLLLQCSATWLPHKPVDCHNASLCWDRLALNYRSSVVFVPSNLPIHFNASNVSSINTMNLANDQDLTTAATLSFNNLQITDDLSTISVSGGGHRGVVSQKSVNTYDSIFEPDYSASSSSAFNRIRAETQGASHIDYGDGGSHAGRGGGYASTVLSNPELYSPANPYEGQGVYPTLSSLYSSGSAFGPTDLGNAGGATAESCGGDGGGALRIYVNYNMSLEGSIEANGNNGGNCVKYQNYYDSNGNYNSNSILRSLSRNSWSSTNINNVGARSGGGAGGSIWMTVGGSISGTGQIQANGGDGGIFNYINFVSASTTEVISVGGGAGSGGRVAVYSDTLNGFNRSQVSVKPGYQQHYAVSTTHGTVTDMAPSYLKVENNNPMHCPAGGTVFIAGEQGYNGTIYVAGFNSNNGASGSTYNNTCTQDRYEAVELLAAGFNATGVGSKSTEVIRFNKLVLEPNSVLAISQRSTKVEIMETVRYTSGPSIPNFIFNAQDDDSRGFDMGLKPTGATLLVRNGAYLSIIADTTVDIDGYDLFILNASLYVPKNVAIGPSHRLVLSYLNSTVTTTPFDYSAIVDDDYYINSAGQTPSSVFASRIDISNFTLHPGSMLQVVTPVVQSLPTQCATSLLNQLKSVGAMEINVASTLHIHHTAGINLDAVVSADINSNSSGSSKLSARASAMSPFTVDSSLASLCEPSDRASGYSASGDSGGSGGANAGFGTVGSNNPNKGDKHYILIFI